MHSNRMTLVTFIERCVRHFSRENEMKKSYIVAAASVFAAGTLATAAHAQSTNKCYGINACKGQSACNSYRTSCKGKNACKGQGMVVTGTSLECTALGGNPTN